MSPRTSRQWDRWSQSMARRMHPSSQAPEPPIEDTFDWDAWLETFDGDPTPPHGIIRPDQWSDDGD
jgi:hypothetical protein